MQQDDKGIGSEVGKQTWHSIKETEERQHSKNKKSMLNVSNKIKTEQHLLDLTELRLSSMSNFSGMSREQSPD